MHKKQQIEKITGVHHNSRVEIFLMHKKERGQLFISLILSSLFSNNFIQINFHPCYDGKDADTIDAIK